VVREQRINKHLIPGFMDGIVGGATAMSRVFYGAKFRLKTIQHQLVANIEGLILNAGSYNQFCQKHLLENLHTQNL